MDFELMNALSIVYPQCWMQLDVNFFFSLHMVIIKKHYCEINRAKPLMLQFVEPLDVNLLDLHMCTFKFIM